MPQRLELDEAGHPEVAEEPDRSLPDPVELEIAAEVGMRYGITRDELISRMGGSPEARRAGQRDRL
jgi:hypothetical protein